MLPWSTWRRQSCWNIVIIAMTMRTIIRLLMRTPNPRKDKLKCRFLFRIFNICFLFLSMSKCSRNLICYSSSKKEKMLKQNGTFLRYLLGDMENARELYRWSTCSNYAYLFDSTFEYISLNDQVEDHRKGHSVRIRLIVIAN